jgi:hypothetical protein
MLSQHFANKFGDSFFFSKISQVKQTKTKFKNKQTISTKSNKQEEEELQIKNSFNPSTQYSSNKHQNA